MTGGGTDGPRGEAPASVDDATAAMRRYAGTFVVALERTRQPMVVTDPRLPDNPIVFANRAFLTLTGYDAAEVVGRNCRFLQGPDTDRAAVAMVRAAVAERREIKIPLLNYRKDGTTFWNELYLCPVFDEAGAVTNFFASQVDVTAAREGEAAQERLAGIERRLADAQRQLEITLTAAGVAGTWDWDIRGKRLHVDDRFAVLNGIDRDGERDGVPTAAFFGRIHPDDRTRVRIAVSGILNGAEVFDREYRLLAPDGAVRWIHARGRCAYAADGAPERFTGALIETTEQKRVEERLRIAQTAGGIGTFEYVPGFATVEVSPQFCSLLGVVPAGTLSANSVNALVAEGGPVFDPTLREAGELPYAEMRVGLADTGETRWLARRGEAVRDDASAELRHVGVVYDVTAAKGAEAELRHLNDTLEARVQDAVSEREQAEERFRQAQKMEAIGQLTGGVAHDFNNLLTIIRSSVDFLRRPNLPQDRRDRYMDAVSDTVDRAARLTGQLLAFARRQALKPEVFEVGARLRAVSDMLDTVTGARIVLSVEVPDEPCHVRADVSQFETALVNMAVNARDAMDGEGRLTLRLGPAGPMPSLRGHAASSSPFAAVSVTDTGSGIPPERLARIFEPFFTTKEVGRGTGLGLSQVFGFAKQSGGDVDVASEVGAGTTFTLYLPSVGTGGCLGDDVRENEGGVPAGAGQRVLVVEDNIEVGRFCTQILADLGYETAWAVNAEEALDMLGSDGSGFRAVFSDVVMPGMGGVELARKLRARLPGLPVVLASGYSHVLAREDDHGFELLHKPYSADQLGRVLGRVLGGTPRYPKQDRRFEDA